MTNYKKNGALRRYARLLLYSLSLVWPVGALAGDGLTGCAPDAYDDRRCIESHRALGSELDYADLGKHAAAAGEVETAFEHFKKGAWTKDDPESWFYYGRAFHYGLGIEVDFAAAARFYLEAVEKEHAQAKMLLADLYYRGHGVVKDPVRAATLMREAAESGIPLAQANYGYLLSTGEGVEVNGLGALHWLGKAIVAGEPLGTVNLAEFYEFGRAGNPVDLDEAERLYREVPNHEHAKQGLARIAEKRRSEAATSKNGEASSMASAPTPKLQDPMAQCKQGNADFQACLKRGLEFAVRQESNCRNDALSPRDRYASCDYLIPAALDSNSLELAIYRSLRASAGIHFLPLEQSLLKEGSLVVDAAADAVRRANGRKPPGVDEDLGITIDLTAASLAEALSQRGHVDELIVLYRKLIDIHRAGIAIGKLKRSPYVHVQSKIGFREVENAFAMEYQLGELLIHRGRALEVAELVQPLIPEHQGYLTTAYLMTLMGDALRIAGELNAALAVYENARVYDPEVRPAVVAELSDGLQARVRLGLGHLYAVQGDLDLAWTNYDRFFEIAIDNNNVYRSLHKPEISDPFQDVTPTTSFGVFGVVGERLVSRGFISRPDYESAEGAELANLVRDGFRDCLQQPSCRPELVRPAE